MARGAWSGEPTTWCVVRATVSHVLWPIGITNYHSSTTQHQRVTTSDVWPWEMLCGQKTWSLLITHVTAHVHRSSPNLELSSSKVWPLLPSNGVFFHGRWTKFWALPPTPIFKVERDPASASIQITIKHNFENWGTGGVGKNTRTYNNWYKSKSKCCGLRILSIYVRPFRDPAQINVLIWFLPSVFFVALVMAMGIGHAFLHSLSYSRTIRIGSL